MELFVNEAEMYSALEFERASASSLRTMATELRLTVDALWSALREESRLPERELEALVKKKLVERRKKLQSARRSAKDAAAKVKGSAVRRKT